MRSLPYRSHLRRNVRLNRLVAVGSAALLTTIGFTTRAAAQPAAAPVAPSLSSAVGVAYSQAEYSQAEAQRIDAYWTPERMRDAAPMPAPTAPVQHPQQISPEKVLPTLSAPGQTPTSAMPNGPNSGVGTQSFSRARQWTAHGRMPASSVGKLFYTEADGNDSSCSGSVITSRNRNTVWTAGHCVAEGGGGASKIYKNFMFAPDYNNGNGRQGRWTSPKIVGTTVGWQDQRNRYFDIGSVSFNPQPGLGNLQDRVGAQGYHFGYGQNFTELNDFGYPDEGYQRTDFNGELLWYCNGNSVRSQFDDQLVMDCDMKAGSSGGPWLQDFQAARGWGYIVGTNSGNRGDIKEFSANHGNAATDVYNFVVSRS
jgi:V8-like Glu-specific endopeptidase